jgi:hypothetical protein
MRVIHERERPCGAGEQSLQCCCVVNAPESAGASTGGSDALLESTRIPVAALNALIASASLCGAISNVC